MTVRRAGPGDEEIVRRLRLEALADAPDAFASTLEHERTRTAADWRTWFAPGATFLVEGPSGPGGLVAGVPHDTDPDAVLLMAMWVRSDLRGTGAADALVGAVLSWARTESVAEVLLHVGQHNERARRCYERSGFQVTGRTLVSERTGIVEVEMRHGLGGGA